MPRGTVSGRVSQSLRRSRSVDAGTPTCSASAPADSSSTEKVGASAMKDVSSRCASNCTAVSIRAGSDFLETPSRTLRTSGSIGTPLALVFLNTSRIAVRARMSDTASVPSLCAGNADRAASRAMTQAPSVISRVQCAAIFFMVSLPQSPTPVCQTHCRGLWARGGRPSNVFHQQQTHTRAGRV